MLISGGYDPEDVVEKIAPVPLLFVHGTADQVVSHENSEILYERAGQPKQLILIEGAPHTAAFARTGPMRARLVEFYRKALDTPSAGHG
jgi:fermentation-respiration switch protein FrsA (DUF1100 family)